MAEPSPDFDSDQFRQDIRAAMVMGLPNSVPDRPTFHFADGRTFIDPDLAGEPFDWRLSPQGAGPKAPLQVTCTVESQGAGSGGYDETQIGVFQTDRANLYFFEEEWSHVWDFTSVWLGQSEYVRLKRRPPIALHDVEIQVVLVQARSEA